MTLSDIIKDNLDHQSYVCDCGLNCDEEIKILSQAILSWFKEHIPEEMNEMCWTIGGGQTRTRKSVGWNACRQEILNKLEGK